MKKIILWVICICLSICLLSGCVTKDNDHSLTSTTSSVTTTSTTNPYDADLVGSGLNPDIITQLNSEMQRQVDARNVAGICAIISKNGVRGYFETFGWADLEKQVTMGKNAIFRIMSMSKPVIALAALTIYDQGKFTLDEPISKYLPEWTSPMVKLADGSLVAADKPITPRMLMSHSAGLSYKGGTEAPQMLFDAQVKPGRTLHEFSVAVATEPLVYQPGESYQYSLSIDILGAYLEAITGKTLDIILKEQLFEPLHMVDTDFYVPAEKINRVPQLYRQPSPGELQPVDDFAKLVVKPTLCLGGHGLYSTLSDYERLCMMIINRGEVDGVKVLKPETVDMIFENQVKHPTTKYGLGGITNSTNSVYGWGGMDGTQFVVDRAQGTYTLFAVQTSGYKAPAYPAFQNLANQAAQTAK